MFRKSEFIESDRSDVFSSLGISASSCVYTFDFDERCVNYILHHKVFGEVIVPSTLFLELLLSALRDFQGCRSIVLEDFLIRKPLFVSDENGLTVYTVFDPEKLSFEIFTITDKVFDASSAIDRIQHVTGHVCTTEEHKLAPTALPLDLESKISAFQEMSVLGFYSICQERGIDYGCDFQVVKKLWRGAKESLGYVEIDDSIDSRQDDFRVNSILLDGCIQTLWPILFDLTDGDTFLPVSVQNLKVYASLPPKVWSYACLRDEQDGDQIAYLADIFVLDEQEKLCVSLEGILVHKVSDDILCQCPRNMKAVAIASTFTAEPIEDSLNFWMQELELPYRSKFAPFNQVFQSLLSPSSLLNQNHDGVNVILARLEDWDRPKATLQADADVRAEVLADQSYTLPNRLEISHLNQYETEYLYQEIFVDKVYAKHGIALKDGDCVVDVGANIGLFTLFAQQQCPNGSIYSFEPAPHAFDKLQRNAKLYCQNARLFNCGLSSENRSETFTFYPNSSVFSSFSADLESDEKAIRAVILNMLQRDASLSEAERGALADEFLRDRLKRETYQAELRTLSSVIEEYGIERIDLLKLDAEKSELPVLLGIKDEHWPMIQQIVVEVHDQVGDIIAEVKRILSVKGFNWLIDEEDLLQSSGLYNIYATRETSPEQSFIGISTSQSTELERNIEDFCAVLKMATSQISAPYIVCLCPPSADAIANSSLQTRYQAAAAALATELQNIKGVHLLDSSLLTTTYAVSNYDDPHGHEFGKVPYTSTFFAALGTAVARTLHATQRTPYKVIVLDCDNTLWQGVCGEAGVEGIRIDAPHQALQSWMLAQQQCGMLLCLCSKNNPADVWAVFDQRSDMSLKQEHIVQAKINWQSKSENIKGLATELQLGLDSFIFIDDNPVECAEVQANCPEVLTLQLPTDRDQIPQFLQHVWAFDQLGTTIEDKQRTVLYQQNIQRDQFRKETLTFADFLAELNIQISITPLTAAQLPRISQLTQRTNQFNFTTIRCSESEIQQLCAVEQHECWVVSLSDRFGDYGVVGALLFKPTETMLQVHSFMLSCRALGRGVEHQMLAKLGEIAQTQGFTQVEVTYLPTSRNQPALDFLNTVGGNFKQATHTGYRFQFPAEFATQLTYTPEVQPAHLQKIPENEASDASVAPTLQSNRHFTHTLNRIATELRAPEQILKVILGSQQRARPQVAAEFVPPANQIETKLAKIWANVLGLSDVGVHDNFFELGGRSLLMVQVHSQLRDQFADSDISPVELFKYPTVYTLAQRLQKVVPEQPISVGQTSDRAERRQEARARRQQRRSQRNG